MRALPARWARLMLVTGAAAIVLRAAAALLFPPAQGDERHLLPVVYPDAYGFSEKGGGPPHYQAFTLDRDGAPAPVGLAFRSTDLVEGIRGYAGEVPLLVGLDREGIVTGVVLLENRETPAYVREVAGQDFLGQFKGKRAGDPFRLDDDIDGVTRATITSAAVAAGVRKASGRAAREILGLDVPATARAPFRPPWRSLAALGALLAAAFVSLSRRGRFLRWPSLLGGLVLIGYAKGIYLNLGSFTGALLWRWPSPREHLLWYVLFAVAVLAALLRRNVYCRRLCPFGALQETAGLLGGSPLPAAADEERRARVFRYLFLWLAALAVFLFDLPDAARFEPFGTAFDFKGGPLRWILLGVVLAAAIRRRRFWCRYFCPTGLTLQLLGRRGAHAPFEEK